MNQQGILKEGNNPIIKQIQTENHYQVNVGARDDIVSVSTRSTEISCQAYQMTSFGHRKEIRNHDSQTNVENTYINVCSQHCNY